MAGDNFSIISIYMSVKTRGLKRSLATENKFIQDQRIYVVWERLHVWNGNKTSS